MGRVQGKTAFITGAGQGQGRSHAVRLAQEGANIIATDICRDLPQISYKQASPDDLNETQLLVQKAGGVCVIRTVDVRDRSQLDEAVEAGREAFGNIDIVVANAGILSLHESSLDITEEVYDLILDVNLKGPWNTIQATAPSMIEAGRGGSIILTSSAAGIRGHIPYAHYVAAKHGVVGLAKAFSNELARHRIRVNAIHPTGVASPGMGTNDSAGDIFAAEPLFVLAALNTLPDLDSDSDDRTPIPMLAEIEISNAVLWLASDEARYVTGISLPVDAGNTNKP